MKRNNKCRLNATGEGVGYISAVSKDKMKMFLKNAFSTKMVIPVIVFGNFIIAHLSYEPRANEPAALRPIEEFLVGRLRPSDFPFPSPK